MGKLLPALMVLILLQSCAKEKPPARKDYLDIQPFLNTYLVCDSIKNIADRYTLIKIYGRGRGQDLQFNEGTFYLFQDVLSVYTYGMRNDTLFYSQLPQPIIESQYFLYSVTASGVLVLTKKTATGMDRSFYHRE